MRVDEREKERYAQLKPNLRRQVPEGVDGETERWGACSKSAEEGDCAVLGGPACACKRGSSRSGDWCRRIFDIRKRRALLS